MYFFASKCQFYLCPLHRLPVTSRVWYPSIFWLCWSAQASRRCLPSFVLNRHRNSDAQHLWQWNVPHPLPSTCIAPALHNLSQWRVTPSEKPGEHDVPSSELRQIGMLLSSQDLIWCCSCCPLVLLLSGEIWWSRLCCLMTHGRVKQGEHAWRLQQALAETLVFLRMLNRWNTIVLFLTSEISHSSYSFLILFPHSWTKCCMEMKPCYLLGWQASLGWVHSQ